MDKTACEALLVEQIPRLRRYARALMRSREHADDLVQDCLERAWSRIHTWRPGSDLRAWLFTILHNLYVNQVRGYQRAPLLVTLEGTDPPSSGYEEEPGALRDLEAGLAALPPEQREVLLLVGLEQMSYEEIATVLGIPLGTVMSRLSRARERLRSHLSGTAGKPDLRRVK